MSFNTSNRTGFVEAEKTLRELSCQMCGGEDFDSYLEEFRSQGQSQCTNVWSKGNIAYRCRTCQTKDSSAICVSCFQGGNHWEHDYVMYHSESGGCCDCGDRAAWREFGFCITHQHVHVGDPAVKEELEKITHSVGEQLLSKRLCNPHLVDVVLKSALFTCKCASEICAGGASILGHQAEGRAKLSELEKYDYDISELVAKVDALRNIVCNDIVAIHVSKQSLGNPVSPLDVLLEYLPRMPEKIIEQVWVRGVSVEKLKILQDQLSAQETTLFLQLLYKNEFKDDFLLVLKNKYEDMIISAVHDKYYLENYKHLDTNLDRVMVQLFNDPDKTTELIHKYNLLELFIGVFCNVVSSSAEKKPAVVTVEKDAIKGKVYLRPQGDLRLIVAHGNIAVSMLIEKPQLFLRILDVLAKLQWMNPYTLVNEIEFENSWTIAIQLEMNSMAIIYQLVSCCYQDPHFGKETLLKAATCTLKSLKQYLKEVALCGPVDTPSKTVSLHIPLHRTLSAILQKLILFPWDGFECGFFSVLDFDYTKEEVLQLMEHPLRISFWMAQIRAQIWRRSSEEFSRLELIYRGSFWHDQSMDMDVLLLQFCSVAHENMQEQVFIRIAEEFNLKSMVMSPLIVDKSRCQSEVVLLQDFIRLILLIVRERRNLRLMEGSDAQDKCLQYDVIQWLCVRDQTYSQLCRALSSVAVDHQKLNATLEKVAVYHEPKVADRGYYKLKPEYWKEFDPLFAHYYLNEMEEAEDRAVKIGKQEQYWRIKAPPAAGAPYDRLSDLLHTKACHLFLMNVLKEVMHLVKLDSSATCGEALGIVVLQMLAVLLSDVRHLNRIQRICDCSKHSPSKFIPSAQVQEEFSTENIFVNIHVTLQKQSESHPSIYQMLMQLQQVNNCSRLVDSVNHVLELLSLSADERSFAAEGISLQVNSRAVEALKRRLKKELRQKAILEEFAAKQRAFWDQRDASQDDNFVFESSHIPLPSIVEKAPHFVGVTNTSCGTITDDVVPMMDAHSVSLSALSQTRECVLCRSKSNMENSSICWIALVQQYNFPSLVLRRKRSLEFSSTSRRYQEEWRSEKDPQKLVTLVCLSELEESAGSCIDHVTAEHIQCCGHQIHFHCFQEHVKTQHRCENSGYAGNDLLDLNRLEFLCPICRRLANVVLPDMDTSIVYKKLLEEDVNSEEKTKEKLKNFWHFNNNLEKAVDFLSSQMLKVRGQFQHHDVSTSSFINCKVLWEGLALNIVHCEVETREGYVMESASSSSVPGQLLDQHTWGGNPSHWIALRELGKLAMLSNILPEAAQEKSQMMVALRQNLGLCDKKESKSGASTSNGLIEVERILEEMFPFSLRTPEEPMGSLPTAGVLVKMSHCDAESRLEKLSEHVEVLHDESAEKLEMRNGDRLGESCFSVPITKSKDTDVRDFDDNKTLDIVSVALGTHKNQDSLTASLLNTATRIHSASEKAASTSVNKNIPSWTSDILKNDVLAADPFGLLIVLFIIFQGQPQKQVILLMVKFAYTVAVLQTQKAVARLDLADSVCERDLVERACLPFLRRAALLVQLITQVDLKGKSRSAGNEYGSKVMDSLYLQQALQLPDCTDIMHSGDHGVETLATALRCLQNHSSKRSTPILYTVPQQVQLHKLPRVFQELLLENIHNKNSCESCKDMPPDLAICLLCGALLCCVSDSCKMEGVGKCSQHAVEESAGIGIFLLLRSTQLLLLRNNRSCMGFSLYLDTHGEEDLHLRRSQLLYLSDLRINEVRRLWMTASFDYDSYILHNSHSRPMFY